MMRSTLSKSPWMSPRAPNSRSAFHLRRNEQVGLVPDEVLVAVDRQLVVLAHEDGRDRAGFLAVAAEDAAGLVDLIDLGVARPGLHGAVVLGRLQIDRVGRAGDGAEAARHALLQPVLVAH